MIVPALGESFDPPDARLVIRLSRVDRDEIEEMVGRIEEFRRHGMANRGEIRYSLGSLARELWRQVSGAGTRTLSRRVDVKRQMPKGLPSRPLPWRAT